MFVLGGRVLAAMRRYAHDDWRTNVAQGGRAEAVTPTADEERLALQAAAAVGADFAGVDLLPTRRTATSSWRSTPCPAGGRWRRHAAWTWRRPSCGIWRGRAMSEPLSIGMCAQTACILDVDSVQTRQCQHHVSASRT